MSYTYKVYLKDDREHFEWECDTQFYATKRAVKKDFEISQSLLDFFYLDVGNYHKIFDRMGQIVRELPTKEAGPKEVPPALMTDLDKIAKEHIFFEFVRLDWFDRLDRYAKGEQVGMWYKDLTWIPMNLGTIQNQLKPLFDKVLNAFADDTKTMPERLASLYGKKGFDTHNSRFKFEPLSIDFAPVGTQIYTDVLAPKNIHDIVDFFLREFMRRDIAFKNCKSCGKYFPASHGNTEYCNRLYEDTGKTCREIGSVKAYQSKVENNPAIKEYNRGYKTHYARIKSGKMTKEQFKEWAEMAREYRDEVTSGKRSLEGFIDWLKNF